MADNKEFWNGVFKDKIMIYILRFAGVVLIAFLIVVVYKAASGKHIRFFGVELYSEEKIDTSKPRVDTVYQRVVVHDTVQINGNKKYQTDIKQAANVNIGGD